ncbi:MAG: response regulator FixJ [Methyloceanibacter sp.]|jgi:two-component system response regulator FixJ|nr:response regulator FixJ [Methyloceanibacter sp.]
MQDNSIVHIVDDDEAVRQSLAFLLGSAGLAVRLYDSATAFLAGLASVKGGCLVTDIRMPDMTGLELLHALKAKGCGLPAIVITGHGDVALAVEAMKAGAVDFIEKPFDEEAILHAVQAALARGSEGEGGDAPAIAARLASLSERERQVLEGLIAGQPNKAIAYDLGISPRTVEVYRANLMTKMEARSLSELIRMAIVAKVAPTRRVSK